MKKFLRRLLGIEELEARVKALSMIIGEKSQTPENTERASPLFGSVLNEWLNGKEGGEDE